jgi:hypothetical protein
MSAKPKIAFFDFTSCEGCQLTIVDLLQTHLGLLDLVEIVQFREAISERVRLRDCLYQLCSRQSDVAGCAKSASRRKWSSRWGRAPISAV